MEEKIKMIRNQEQLNELISQAGQEAINEYIQRHPQDINIFGKVQENGKLNMATLERINNCIESIENEYLKAVMIMSINCDSKFIKLLCENIQEEYYKRKINEGMDIYNPEPTTNQNIFVKMQIEKMKEYENTKQELKKCYSETEEAEYIASLKDNDIKLSLLPNIKRKNNREKIINTLTREIDEQIREIDNLAQNMIIEFFQDAYNGEIPQEKKEKMMIALKNTNMCYGNFANGITGKSYYTYNLIKIDISLKENKPKEIGAIIREYAHIMSNINWKSNPVTMNENIEEGNADIFADLVINHYLKKYQNRNIGFEINVPYQTFSIYDTESASVRTLLYPLEREGKDIQAICEYTIGDKIKYLTMVLTPEISNKILQEARNNISSIRIKYDDIYKSHEGKYVNPNKQSIYFRRNAIIEKFVERDEETHKNQKEENTYKIKKQNHNKQENTTKLPIKIVKKESFFTKILNFIKRIFKH